MTAARGQTLPQNSVAEVEKGAPARPADLLSQPTNHRIDFDVRREVPWLNKTRVDDRAPVENAVDPYLLRGTRVLIVDDCTLYREYLAGVLAAHGAPFSGVAWDLPSLMSAVKDELPRVILINMTTQNSDFLLRQARLLGPQVRVVATGVADDDESRIVACAEAGVAGYHMRSDSLQELLKLVERVAKGETLCSSRVSAILLRELSTLAAQRPGPSKELVLTEREDQILSMLELGLSNRDIADKLCIAVHTVKNHVHSLLNKLEVGSRAQAAAVARSTRGSDRRN